MERLTIETPDAYAAVSLSLGLERAGLQPLIERADARLAVAVSIDDGGLTRILGIVQAWLDAEEIGSARLRLHEREFVLAA